MTEPTRKLIRWTIIVLIAFPLSAFLDQALPQTPAAKPDAASLLPKPLSDADARSFHRLQVTVLESRVTMAAAEKDFTAARDRHDQAVAEIQALLVRLRKDYRASGCELGKDLDWVTPDPATKQLRPCTPSASASASADGQARAPEKPKSPAPERK